MDIFAVAVILYNLRFGEDFFNHPQNPEHQIAVMHFLLGRMPASMAEAGMHSKPHLFKTGPDGKSVLDRRKVMTDEEANSLMKERGFRDVRLLRLSGDFVSGLTPFLLRISYRKNTGMMRSIDSSAYC